MRALAVSIWVFINLVFFGMCGYMYLLWSQYWINKERQSESSTSVYDQQIYFYNRGYYPGDVVLNKTLLNSIHEAKPRKKHSTIKDNSSVTIIKNSKPRYVTKLTSWVVIQRNYVSDFLICSRKILNLIRRSIIVWKVTRNLTVI